VLHSEREQCSLAMPIEAPQFWESVHTHARAHLNDETLVGRTLVWQIEKFAKL